MMFGRDDPYSSSYPPSILPAPGGVIVPPFTHGKIGTEWVFVDRGGGQPADGELKGDNDFDGLTDGQSATGAVVSISNLDNADTDVSAKLAAIPVGSIVTYATAGGGTYEMTVTAVTASANHVKVTGDVTLTGAPFTAAQAVTVTTSAPATNPAPPPDDPPAPLIDPSTMTVQDVTAWVQARYGDSCTTPEQRDELQVILDAERTGQNRSTLISFLEGIL